MILDIIQYILLKLHKDYLKLRENLTLTNLFMLVHLLSMVILELIQLRRTLESYGLFRLTALQNLLVKNYASFIIKHTIYLLLICVTLQFTVRDSVRIWALLNS